MSSFFVSYNKADKAWAEWIAWTLEEAGHTVVIQAWDFRPGGNFVLDMQRAAAETDKTLVVLSEDYLNAEFTQPEWAAAFADDPTSLQRKVIPIRVQKCKPRGLLRPIVYVDLVELDADAARQVVLNALPERLKPYSEPPFPKTRQAEKNNEQPAFPNEPVLKPWNVPYERNSFFTGREEVLQTLHQRLSQDKAAGLSQIQAIHGLGGIGKTQAAVEYAYRHRQDYQAVFWVRAETDLEVRTGFVEIARLLNLSQQDAQDPDDTLRAVKHWLETNSDWLLIFDNADHPALLRPFRPNQASGHILVTSRAQTFDMLGISQPVSLQEMPADEAVAFLFKRANRHTNDSAEQAAATALADELGFLPLALEQAGAFILRRKLRFSTYFSQYRKQRLALLERQQPTVGNEQQIARSVQTTWQLNFEAVREINPASAELLQVSAFVAPDKIPYESLISGRESLGNFLSNALESEDQEGARFVIAELLEPLSQYSLIRVDPDTDSFTIHRLVQEVVKVEMDEAQCRLWAERTIGAVTQAFPNAEYGNWPSCDRLLPHAKVVIHLATTSQIESETTARLSARMGSYLKERAQYSEAESLFQDTLAMRKRLLGDKHPDVAESLNNLAEAYHHQGRYSEAEPLYRDALMMRKRLLGDEHPDVTESLNNLGLFYYYQERYGEAEPLLQDALAMRKRLLGDEHPDVAQSFNNLALLYNNQERYSEAELLYQDALALWKRLLGDEHPDIARGLNNLALLYSDQERYSEAEPLLQDSLAMRKQLLGDEHPDVACALYNLALLYDNQGRCSEAEPLYQDALALVEQILGPDHPHTNLVRGNLQELQERQNQ
ncbi:MAG: tetratricopeptide repeat protein [Cyanobacteria bacterium P01_H01_bin.21]